MRDHLRLHEVAGLRLAAPGDAEPLRDRRLPSWARLSPSCVVLARLVASELRDRLAGRYVIELGCGLGAPGMAAARGGALVILTDAEPKAVAVVAENARRNSVHAGSLRLSWDRVPDAAVGWFDVVLAADVAHDRRQIGPLVRAIHALLKPGGEAWIADPGPGTQIFLSAAARAGLDATLVRTEPHPGGVLVDGAPCDVHVYRLVRT